MLYRDRAEAGRRLAQALLPYVNEHPIILALPRGGVPIAAEVAAALHAPLDLVFVRKIGVPGHEELAMGAVVDGPNPLIVRNEDIIRLTNTSEKTFAAVRDRECAEIERRRQRYVGMRVRADITQRVAIVIDDGIATGASARAALQALRLQKPKMLILAVPVGAAETIEAMKADADAVVCPEEQEALGSIGAYYADFRQISDEEVVAILERFPASSAR